MIEEGDMLKINFGKSNFKLIVDKIHYPTDDTAKLEDLKYRKVSLKIVYNDVNVSDLESYSMTELRVYGADENFPKDIELTYQDYIDNPYQRTALTLKSIRDIARKYNVIIVQCQNKNV